MKAVAMMTPEPKNLAMKKAHSGTLVPLCLWAKTGKTAPIDSVSLGRYKCKDSYAIANLPSVEVIRITNTAEMRAPISPL